MADLYSKVTSGPTAWDVAHKQCFLKFEEHKLAIIKLEVRMGHVPKYSGKWWRLLQELDLLTSQIIVIRKMMDGFAQIIALQPYDPKFFERAVFEAHSLLTNEVKK